MAKKRARKRKSHERAENINLSYSQRQRVFGKVSNARVGANIQADIKRMNRDIANATRYKNPYLPTHTEKRVYTIGGVKVTKTIQVQSPLEKRFRQEQRLYGQWSNRMAKENGGKGYGHIRTKRLYELYQEGGERRVNEWLKHLHDKRTNMAYEWNSQDLFGAIDKLRFLYEESLNSGDIKHDEIGRAFEWLDLAEMLCHQRLKYGVVFEVKKFATEYIYTHYKPEMCPDRDYDRFLKEMYDFLDLTLVNVLDTDM